MFDVVVHDDRPWLVMEYLPSRSLAGVLADRGALPAAEVADIGRQVADGLAAAHAAGVVHRDVKPGNVLITDDGLVKLSDFGVSRAVDEVQLTRTGLIAGTPAFLSPEVARGLNPTAASDVFALGATLYAAVEGTPPFGLDDNAYALLHKVATEPVRPPKQDGPVVDVIMRLLSRVPEDRPSAAQARDALVAAGAGRDTGLAPLLAAVPVSDAAEVPPAPAGQPPTLSDLQGPEPERRRNRLVPVLIGVLAILAVGIGVTAAILSGGRGTETGSGTPEAQSPTHTAATEPSNAPAAPTDAVAFVQNYYGLLPGNTDAAWQLLGAQAQSQSGGKGGYDSFWADMRSVSLQNVRRIGENTVQGTVIFTRRDGSTTSEPYRFVMGTGSDGQTIMQSFSRL
jgi:eukaryotic-like serine/threonine-protein kinase